VSQHLNNEAAYARFGLSSHRRRRRRRRYEIHAVFTWENLKERDDFEDTDTDRKIRL
jgi:hypothetical protein